MMVLGVLVDTDGLVLDDDARGHLADLADRRPVGLVATGSIPVDGRFGSRFAFTLESNRLGVHRRDRRMLLMAAAGLGCHPNEIVVVGADPRGDVARVAQVGGRSIWLNPTGGAAPRGSHPDAVIGSLAEVRTVLDRFEAEAARAAHRVGVGPHPQPWPDGDHLDPDLLAHGDRRNVVDRFRYWREEAVAAELARRARPFHVAVENWRLDRNIGTVVRNANGFGAAGVHIVGPRRWNRRGAMATDRYLAVEQHEDIDAFVTRMRSLGLVIVAVDNVEGSAPIESTDLPERSVLVFGQEGPGLTSALLDHADQVVAITQRGSTRSLNAGVAAGIAMYEWSRQHPVTG